MGGLKVLFHYRCMGISYSISHWQAFPSFNNVCVEAQLKKASKKKQRLIAAGQMNYNKCLEKGIVRWS